MKDKILELLGERYDIDSSLESQLDHFFECINTNSGINSQKFIDSWLKNLKNELKSVSKPISLSEVLNGDYGWNIDSETGNIKHESGGFFEVIGVDVDTNIRESGKGWKQPMVDQGTESSIAGIIKKKFGDTYHYLLEGKFEPGNYGEIQLSPTLQVTYSNLHKLHGGQKPKFTEYFDNTKKVKVLYNHWLPEDGGRFYKKRVKNMLVEVSEDEEVITPANFIWLTMKQIKSLLKQDDIINTHVRSIIAHI